MSAHRKKHPFDFKTQYGLGFNQQDDEIGVDFFCGGSGAGGDGGKSSVVSLRLLPEHVEGALRAAAFLINYYGTENVSSGGGGEPAPTMTTKDRLALVSAMVKGTPYMIMDICLRMLKPSEAYKAQGFPDDYATIHSADGKPPAKTQ